MTADFSVIQAEVEARRKRSMSTPIGVDAVVQIGIGLLEENPYQPRVDYKNIDELSRSIQKNGQIHPILITPIPGNNEKYYIVAGHRRTQAVKVAGLMKINAVIKHTMSLEELKHLAIAENLNREQLAPAEIVLAIKGLMADNPKILKRDISSILSISQSALSNYVKALRITEKDLLELKENDVGRDILMYVASIKDPSIYSLVIEKLKGKKPLTIKEVRAIAHNAGTKKRKSFSINTTTTSATIFYGTTLTKQENEIITNELKKAMRMAQKEIIKNRANK